MKTLILLLALLVVGCGPTPEGKREEKDGYTILVIDGCEYIEVESGVRLASNYSYSLTHKGNCKNKEHER